MDYSLDGNDWQLCPLLPVEWKWRRVWDEDWNPAKWPVAGAEIPGTVPGDVVADSLDAGLIPHPYVDIQSRACEWVSQRDWVYRKRFSLPVEFQARHLQLRFQGVDHACHVFLNGQPLGGHEGMFLPFAFDVTQSIRFDKPNLLVVIVEHAPPVEAVQGQIGRTLDARTWKARFAYNWDWCTRLVPVGVWQSIDIVATGDLRLEDVWVRQQLLDGTAFVKASVQLAGADSDKPWTLHATIKDPSGALVTEQQCFVQSVSSDTMFQFEITDPQLWWPNGMGDQNLYELDVVLQEPDSTRSQSRTIPFGIRTIRMLPNAGAPDNALPYIFEVNGSRMFVKGWNWVPIDHMYGRPQAERYEHLLKLAQHANANLLRVWGGGLLERELFYDLCDKLGILVWQEFMHSSSGPQNAPPTDEPYLDYIEHQARIMIPLRRNHTSLALWCGGNELMDDNSVPLDDRHPALARLKAVVEQLDPGRAWLPTSASGPAAGPDKALTGTGKMHDVHGPWQYWGPEKYYDHYNHVDYLYHSEFGAEGATNLRCLEKFISPQFRFPANEDNVVWAHHGSWWLHQRKFEEWFGPFENLDQFLRASQWIQAEGLRYAIEADRRRKWQCSGASPWQFNEAFPNAACTNVVDYTGAPKPAYWWARNAYEPVHLSLRYERLGFRPGDAWKAELWVNNSGAQRQCTWRAQVMTVEGGALLEHSGAVEIVPEGSLKITDLCMAVPDKQQIWLVFVELLDSAGQVLSRNEYLFSSSDPPFAPLLHLDRAEIECRTDGNSCHLINKSGVTALLVHLIPEEPMGPLVDKNYFSLRPGETCSVGLSGAGKLAIQGMNTNEVQLVV